MHIIIKNTFLSLPFVSHDTTLGKKPYINLWYFITYSTILTANLICTLVLGTKIFYSQTNWRNCFGSVDGTALRILRSKINQSIVYNDHKRAQGIKLQSLPLPNGLIGNVSSPYLGKLDMIVPCHTSLGWSRIYRDQYWHNNHTLCIYGEPVYLSLFHLQAPFSRQNLPPNPVNYNKVMIQARVAVEWLFNEIETYFKSVSYTNICLFSNSP